MLKLLRWKARIEIARYRARRLALLGPALMVVLVAFTFWVARALFGALVDAAPEFADFLLLVVYAAAGLFLAVAALRWGVQRLFLSSDLELMMALPVPSRNILAVKALEIVVSSPTAALMLTAMTWGYLRAHDQPTALLVALIAVVPLVLGAALPGMLVTLLLVRVLSRAHVRALLAILPALIGVSFVFVSPVIGGFERVVSGRFDVDRLERIAASGRALRVLPTSWAADVAIGLGSGQIGVVARSLLLLMIAITGLAAVTYAAFDLTFRTSWTQMAEASTRIRRGTVLERLAPPFPAPIRATVIKEWRTFFRDLRIVASTFFPALFLGYFVVSNASEEGGMGWFLPLFFLTFVFPGVASTALLGERRNIALYKAAPTTGLETLLGKLAAYGLPLATLLAVLASVFGILSGRSFVEVVLMNVLALWTLGWVMLTHLAVAGFWARFDAEKPTLPFFPSIAGMLATSIVGLTQVLLGLWVAGQTGTDVGLLSHPLLGVPVIALAGGCCVGAAFAALGAGSRLDRLDAP